MTERRKLARISSLRRLREELENERARKVARTRAAVESARDELAAVDRTIRSVEQELASMLSSGVEAHELAYGHAAWLRLRQDRLEAAETLARCVEARRAAMTEYLEARQERMKMERWEERTAERVRLADHRAESRSADEFAVIRYARQAGRP